MKESERAITFVDRRVNFVRINDRIVTAAVVGHRVLIDEIVGGRFDGWSNEEIKRALAEVPDTDAGVLLLTDEEEGGVTVCGDSLRFNLPRMEGRLYEGKMPEARKKTVEFLKEKYSFYRFEAVW